MRLLSTIFAVGLLTACAADPAKVQAVAEDEAARLDVPTSPLSTFAEFELQDMTFVDLIRNEENKLAEGREFESNLKAKIGPLLEGWNEAGTGSGKLILKPHLSRLKIVSGGARFWAGAFAGDSFIEMDLVLINADTNQTVADVNIRRDADSMTGAWSVGKSDQNLDEYVVSIVHEYLSDNY